MRRRTLRQWDGWSFRTLIRVVNPTRQPHKEIDRIFIYIVFDGEHLIRASAKSLNLKKNHWYIDRYMPSGSVRKPFSRPPIWSPALTIISPDLLTKIHHKSRCSPIIKRIRKNKITIYLIQIISTSPCILGQYGHISSLGEYTRLF